MSHILQGPRGIITLTTDFGLSDHYVGVVKGVILGINPQAHIVDLCHQIEPYDVLGAGLTLAASYAYFPSETVHLIVVDPGVGSARRAIVVEAGRWLFVAPDNGVLEFIYREHPHCVRALRLEEVALKPISNTFHGRDVFAPAAGLLSGGEPPQRLGDPIEDYVRLELPCPRAAGRGILRGAVLKVDRFGNVITNLRPSDLPTAFCLTIGATSIKTLRPAYAGAVPGEIFALPGSSGYLEISINQGSAAAALGAAAGMPVEVADLEALG